MTYRNTKLLKLAKDCPHCMSCGKDNDGTIVAAHSDQQADGKGMGHKAHDYRIAYLCFDCHQDIHASKSRIYTQEMFNAAHRRTIGWLFDSGHIEVKA